MGFMDERLFHRLIDECLEYPVKQISPYLMADPLTDKRIFRFVDYIARKRPGIHIELSTTGQLLNGTNAERLLDAPLGELRISSTGIRKQDYDLLMPGISFDQAMRNIDLFLELYYGQSPHPYPIYIVTVDGLLDEDGAVANQKYWDERRTPIMSWEVTSRAGSVQNRVPVFHTSTIVGCASARNSHWMNILHDGRAILCCMDWKHETTLGDTKTSPLKEIWEGKLYSRMREITSGLVSSPPDFICRRCEWALTNDSKIGQMNSHAL